MSYYNTADSGNGGGHTNWQQQQQQPPQYDQQQQQQQHGNFQQGYGDPNAWQQQQPQQYGGQQQQHPQQHSYPPQQQQQPQPQQTFWNPATAAVAANLAFSGLQAVNNTGAGRSNGATGGDMFDLAANAASQTFLHTTAARTGALQSIHHTLRQYFAVDNAYVLAKMRRVLVPVMASTWKRQQKELAPNTDGSVPPPTYMLPVHDDCAPDLYLPIMTGITYVLLSALLYGTAGQFSPHIIPAVTSTCFITQVLEVAAIRCGFYLMQANVAMLDLFSYTGYKYLGLCINMCVGIVMSHLNLGGTGYYITFAWTASAMCYFMLKTMANNIPPVTARGGPKREVMVVAFAGSQFAAMWFVSQTKFL